VLTVTTKGVAPADQPDYWQSVVQRYFFAVHGTSLVPKRNGFAGRMDRLAFGGLSIDRVAAQPYRVVRSDRLVRREPSDTLVMFVLRRGEVAVAQDGRAAPLRKPGEFAIVDSAAAYTAEFVTPCQLTMIQIPRAWIGPRLRALGDRTATALDGRAGLAGLAVSTLLALRVHAADRDDDLACAAAKNAVELTTAAVLERGGETAERHSPRSAILHRAQRYMLDHLADPDLAPAQVAAAIPISERYLFTAFREAGTTPVEWLRRTRLERARAYLAQVGGPGEAMTIQQVANAVGLPRASHFSRLFRERYGVSPREYRAGRTQR